ncbi:MAG: AAA-like domain protein [Candidatus Bathyarchaeota archaeon BA2]|nr:MAG: AAA-like domain protein [Candidatus Bathyarchaeota archaeon BA2]
MNMDSNDIKRTSIKTCYASKFSIDFDIPEQQKSNTLIVGTNSTGKSRLACGIASILQNLDWRIIVFDNVGNYQKISDVPFYYTLKANDHDDGKEEWYIPFPSESMIYDMSLLVPDMQRNSVNFCLEQIWNKQVLNPSKWTLIILEEAQLYLENLRGKESQNIMRIASAGRNHRIRVLAVSSDLALIDSSFIRLCSQLYYGRINPEENVKRKMRNYHGLDWLRIAQELDLGYFIYMLGEKLKIINVPLFEPKRTPQPYHVPIPILPQPKSLWQRLKELF